MLRRASVTNIPQIAPEDDPVYHLRCIYALMERQNELLADILETVEEQRLRPSIEEAISVGPIPITLSRNSRRHTRIWVANAANCLISNITGGFGAFTLQAGWNDVDLVEGAQIMVQSGPVFNALWQCLDTVLSGSTL